MHTEEFDDEYVQELQLFNCSKRHIKPGRVYKCIIAIREDGSTILVADHTEYDELEVGVEEYLELENGVFWDYGGMPEECGKCFKCDITIHRWFENSPIAYEWNVDVCIENLIELK